MSVSSIEAAGLDRFVQTLDDALADLQDLTPVRGDVAALLEAAAQPRTPRRTGRLAGTVTAVTTPDGVTLTAGGPGAPYGVYVHARDPWLRETVQRSTDAVTDRVATHVDQSLSNIRGA